MTRRKSET